jgi:hypothetical protein
VVPVRKIVLDILEQHARSKNAELAVSTFELTCKVYETQHPSRANLSATSRALNSLSDEGVERIKDADSCYWLLRRVGNPRGVTRKPHLDASIAPMQLSLYGGLERQRRPATR